MLALRRLRCPPHCIPACQARLLRTKPRPIPSYIRQWDPTQHEPRGPTGVPHKPTEPNRLIGPQASSEHRESSGLHGFSRDRIEQLSVEAIKDDSRQVANAQLDADNTEDIVIKYTSRNPQIERGKRRLQYLLNSINSNNALNPILRGPLWRAYKEGMRYIPSLPNMMSRRAWNVLWKSQYMDFSDTSRRQRRLIELYGHLAESRGFFDLAGQVAYRLERKFMAGLQQKALELWKDFRHHYPASPEFLDTGARLYALEGFPDRAREIMDQLLRLEPDWDVSVMLVVFRAYTSSQREQHLEEARQMYKAIKAKLGNKGSLEMYDNCLIGFLEARSLADARQVFGDMVTEGHFDYDGAESQIELVLRRLNRLYALGTDVASMSSIALDAIALLPVAYHGHVFTDWMKFALVQKAPQAIAQILDMMIERGYRPEAVHFDFLLQALFRTKASDDVLKAENLGWKMVEEARLSSMPMDRPAPESRLMAIKAKLDSPSVPGTNPAIQMPAATTSTFALLMSHHAQRWQWEHVDYLIRQLKAANVAADCTIMNVIINIKSRREQFVEAWQIYKSLTDNLSPDGCVFPNGATIRSLWTMLRLAFNNPANRGNPDLPTPRELLHETMNWWKLVRLRFDADRFLQGLAGSQKTAVHWLMLHCFSYAQDLAGALVALHVLRLEFNIYPTQDQAGILCRQIAWVPLHGETDSVRRQFSLSSNSARSMERLGRTYQRVRKRRLRKLNADPSIEQPLTEADAGDFELNAISEFVRVVLLANRPPDVVELLIQDAQQAAGVLNIPTGDTSAFDLDKAS